MRSVARTRLSVIGIVACAALSCARAATRAENLDSPTIAGCYSLRDGPWRTDSAAKSFFSLWNIPTEIKLRSTRLPGWDPVQTDSLPLLAVETREKSLDYSSETFHFWQRLHPESDTIYVGTPLAMGGVAMNLVKVGSTLHGKIFSFTDSPGSSDPLGSFPIILRRIDCW
jgi:hypothetical protein